MPVQIDHLHPCIVLCLKQRPDSFLADEAKNSYVPLSQRLPNAKILSLSSSCTGRGCRSSAAVMSWIIAKLLKNFLFVFHRNPLQHTMQLLLQVCMQKQNAEYLFQRACWYVSIPFFILIFIMLSRSIICSKFRIACHLQLFPFWMIQPNEMWTNPTNKLPMQTAKTAAVHAYNDDRTVTKQSKPAAEIE